MRQKGQTLVEFALVVPILIFLFLSILYFGIMFMEYTQYNNAARDAARDIALIQTEGGRTEAVEEINDTNTESETHLKRIGRYALPLTKLYAATWHADFLDSDGNPIVDSDGNPIYNKNDAVDVKVTITLKRDAPIVLGSFHILPDELRTIEFTMRLEPEN